MRRRDRRQRRARAARVACAVSAAAAAFVLLSAVVTAGRRPSAPDAAAAAAAAGSPQRAAETETIEGPAPGPFAPARALGARICPAPSEAPSTARQLVVVDAVSPTGSDATLDLLVHDGDEWRCVLVDVPARVGRNGVRPLAARRSGDGTTPSGVFPLGETTAPDGQVFHFFGNGSDPGVQGAWRDVQAGDCWVATPHEVAYNTLVSTPAGACRSPDEYLPAITGAYSAAALIGANMGADRSGDDPSEPPLAAAIFLHRFSYDASGASRATSGCVSLAADDLATVLRALRPGEAWFVIR